MTRRQAEYLTLIKYGGSIIWHCSPGRLDGGYYLEKKGDNRDLDGRTCQSIIENGWVDRWSAGHHSTGYSINETGKLALARHR